MKYFALALVCLCLAYTAVRAEEFEPLTLTSSNFWSTINSAPDEPWLLEFYAPWCGHCQRLEPVWKDVAREMAQRKNDGSNFVNTAKLDASANRDVSSKFKVESFPTIKLIANGKMYTYSGERTYEKFLDWSLSGYESSPSARAPQAPSWEEYLHEQYDKLFSDAEHILEYKKNAIIVITVFSFLFGTLFGVIFCGPSAPKHVKAKRD